MASHGSTNVNEWADLPTQPLRPAASVERPRLAAPPPDPREPVEAPASATPKRRRARTVAVVLGVLALIAAVAAAAIATDDDPADSERDRAGDSTSAVPASNGSPTPTFPDWPIQYQDRLETQRNFSAAAYPSESATCRFEDKRLVVKMDRGGIIRCPGQADALDDFALTVDVYLLSAHGKECAGIWFRRGAHEDGKDAGYVLQVCATSMVIGQHRSSGKIDEIVRFRSPPIAVREKAVVGLVLRGNEISVFRDKQFVGTTNHSAYPSGRLTLGIAIGREVGSGSVGFQNVAVHWPDLSSKSLSAS